jgi:RHH-type rel operon transcriptional repressor/antitoxin RelB
MTASLRLPETLEKRLEAVAQQMHHSKDFCLRQALEEYLEDREDYLSASAIKQRILSGEEKTYSLDEVKKMCGLKDD